MSSLSILNTLNKLETRAPYDTQREFFNIPRVVSAKINRLKNTLLSDLNSIPPRYKTKLCFNYCTKKKCCWAHDYCMWIACNQLLGGKSGTGNSQFKTAICQNGYQCPDLNLGCCDNSHLGEPFFNGLNWTIYSRGDQDMGTRLECLTEEGLTDGSSSGERALLSSEAQTPSVKRSQSAPPQMHECPDDQADPFFNNSITIKPIPLCPDHQYRHSEEDMRVQERSDSPSLEYYQTELPPPQTEEIPYFAD